MRVEGAADAGAVKVLLSYDGWADGKVAPAAFELPIPPRKEAGKK